MFNTTTLDNLENNLALFHKMYDVIRLVDPVNKVVLEYRGHNGRKIDEACYLYWKIGKICDNCISIRAHLNNKCYSKLELSSKAIMLVTAVPIENADNSVVVYC